MALAEMEDRHLAETDDAAFVQVGRKPFGRVVPQNGAEGRGGRISTVAGAFDGVAIGAEVARDLMADGGIARLPNGVGSVLQATRARAAGIARDKRM